MKVANKIFLREKNYQNLAFLRLFSKVETVGFVQNKCMNIVKNEPRYCFKMILPYILNLTGNKKIQLILMLNALR